MQGEGTLTSSRVTAWGHEPKGADGGGPISLEIGNEGPPNQWLRSREAGGWGFENRRQSMKYGFGEEERKLRFVMNTAKQDQPPSSVTL